ncbi:C-C motif chemokine 3-like [Toxotes jaculatrix]|uniref:C-C motif chemokine 3-like n=1 Tax=Toxotes jaculatrix TaxID=941984 RepID=UPI001B3A7EA1|nr:C-C motif chemokine 3-like [Toxotes jaculatrix]
MAPRGDAKLFFCSLLITCYCSVTMAQMAMDCCLTVANKTIEKQFIADYYQQTSGRGCSIDATILVTRRERTLCAPPGEFWVQEVVKHVENLKKACKKNRKLIRCKGMKKL